MYLQTGSSGDAGSLAITTAVAAGDRSYKIKVSYIECSSLTRCDCH